MVEYVLAASIVVSKSSKIVWRDAGFFFVHQMESFGIWLLSLQVEIRSDSWFYWAMVSWCVLASLFRVWIETAAYSWLTKKLSCTVHMAFFGLLVQDFNNEELLQRRKS